MLSSITKNDAAVTEIRYPVSQVSRTDFAKCLLKIVVSKKATILLQELLLPD